MGWGEGGLRCGVSCARLCGWVVGRGECILCVSVGMTRASREFMGRRRLRAHADRDVLPAHSHSSQSQPGPIRSRQKLGRRQFGVGHKGRDSGAAAQHTCTLCACQRGSPELCGRLHHNEQVLDADAKRAVLRCQRGSNCSAWTACSGVGAGGGPQTRAARCAPASRAPRRVPASTGTTPPAAPSRLVRNPSRQQAGRPGPPSKPRQHAVLAAQASEEFAPPRSTPAHCCTPCAPAAAACSRTCGRSGRARPVRQRPLVRGRGYAS